MRLFSGAAHSRLACIHAALAIDASSDERIARSMATIDFFLTTRFSAPDTVWFATKNGVALTA